MKFNASSLLLIIAGCSFPLIADSRPPWGWWWRRWRCDTEITITITSSECSRPLSEGVYIWANRNSRVIDSSDGVYTLRVCSLPVTIYIWKYGFRFTRILARHTEETVILQCTGSGCEGTTTVQASISSSCGQPLDGVTFESQDIMSVTPGSSSGIYNLEVCSLPLEVTCAAEGYESLTSTITEKSVEMQMTCIGSNCGSNEITLEVKSSDCNTPLSDVTITSDDVMTVTEAEPGTYHCEVCKMPVKLSLEKKGFESMSTTVSGNHETLTLTCSEPMCTAESITATVTSECGTLLDGVQLASEGVPIETTTPSTGVYELSVCSLPQTVTAEKTEYDTATHEITGDTETIRMTCKAGSCSHLQKTITVRSSDCKQLVGDVTITPKTGGFLLVTSTSTTGLYQLEVCSFPVEIILEKDGFISKTATIEMGVSDVELQCDGLACTAPTASVSVTSDCATIPVAGVAIGGPDVIGVSSSALGSYQIAACSLPTLASFEMIGHAALQTTVDDSSSVTLACIELPIIVADPQSKYRSEGENVTLCCQAKPATGVTYKWFKDGTEIASETNNELSLTSLESNNQGRYQCSAKLTADPNLPAVRSEEAMLTIKADPDSCSDAWRSLEVLVFPGCTHDVGQCLKRRCRSSGTKESCSDDKECCAKTRFDYPSCAKGKGVRVVVSCSCNCPAPNTIVVEGIVEDSVTDSPILGITVTLVGETEVATTDVAGEYSLKSVPASRRRLVLKASDPTGTYLDNYVVHTVNSKSSGPETVNIAMVKKAPLIKIDPTKETTLSISNDPLDQNAGPAFLRVPANAFFDKNGEKYQGPVFVSLTYLDPSERLEDAPGEFTTLNLEGLPETLVTFGVYAVELEDDSGNPIHLNNYIEVYATGSTSYFLWWLDEHTGTWVLIESLPGRKKRQDSQEQLIGSFIPQSGRWYNIDKVLRQPKCYFRTRVFLDEFSEGSEVTTSLTVVPKVRQILAISDNSSNGVKYRHEGSTTGCFEIRCPIDTASAKISAIAYEPVLGVKVEVPLMPAAIDDYSTPVKDILQPIPYNYELFNDDTSKIFVNTQRAVSGPFYESNDDCMESSFDQPAFWFAKQPEFVEGDFYDGTEDRCVGRLKINIWSVLDPDDDGDFTTAKINALSIWSDNKYGLKLAPIYELEIGDGIKASCFEYRCSIENFMTSVYIDLSDNMTQYECYFYGNDEDREQRKKRGASPGGGLNPPILNSTEMQNGYFLNKMSDVDDAINRCLAETETYAGEMHCNPFYAMPAK